MKMRKTFYVANFVDSVNDQLRNGMQSRDFRRGLIASVEAVLHSTGQYAGFKYLSKNDVFDDIQPGVNYTDTGICPEETRFLNTDPTRVQYFYKG
jgi:hypothetical protein